MTSNQAPNAVTVRRALANTPSTRSSRTEASRKSAPTAAPVRVPVEISRPAISAAATLTTVTAWAPTPALQATMAMLSATRRPSHLSAAPCGAPAAALTRSCLSCSTPNGSTASPQGRPADSYGSHGDSGTHCRNNHERPSTDLPLLLRCNIGHDMQGVSHRVSVCVIDAQKTGTPVSRLADLVDLRTGGDHNVSDDSKGRLSAKSRTVIVRGQLVARERPFRRAPRPLRGSPPNQGIATSRRSTGEGTPSIASAMALTTSAVAPVVVT